MERLEKIKMAIEKGITCNPETGKVYGVKGKELINKVKGYIYISITENKKINRLRAHQFIYYIATGKIVEQIDHINGVRDDNRIENLREVTKSQNQRNRVNAKGYYWNKQNKKWHSSINNNGIIYLGSFNTEQEAHEAYLDAKKIYHKL
jgi:hypothetical protein